MNDKPTTTDSSAYLRGDVKRLVYAIHKKNQPDLFILVREIKPISYNV